MQDDLIAMLTQIQKIKDETDFDFRRFANPQDPLAYLFPEWVDYYRTKYAICRALEPKSIFEVGVRYGYSAITFLNAAPNAVYVGMDNDSNQFGGASGALEWAKQHLVNYSAHILLADSQKLTSLPGDYFDLMHVDGQQDGDSTFHDLELGLEKARWLLVDGFFWSRENMLSATFFMEKYRRLICAAYVIPGYAGDLLIETRTRRDKRVFRSKSRHHSDLRETYDADYFLGDCGGYEVFKAHAGRRLTDARLSTLFDICSPTPGMRILDVGCGRGELTYACFHSGAMVVGLDYSQSAIDIAQETFADCLGDRLSFVHTDVLEYDPQVKFDAILAADVVEHLSKDALDAAFARFASWLKPTGKLIIHTWPNRIAYEHNYSLRRRAARAAGGYLPKNPRTYYEDLMHINEQTPAKLRRSLRRAFAGVAVWLPGAAPHEASQGRPHLRDLVRKAESIFAIATLVPLEEGDVRKFFEQSQLRPEDAQKCLVESAEIPTSIAVNSQISCTVTLVNHSAQSIGSLAPFPVHLSYHWYRDGVMFERDGIRTKLTPRWQAGERRSYPLVVKAPAVPGSYSIGVTLVQEGRFWFDDLADSTCLFKAVEVV